MPDTSLPPAAARRTAAAKPDRRQAILLAAERLFADRGYHAVSMRDIATAAEVPVALVSYHYGSKQALYRAIFESWLPSIEQRRARLASAMQRPRSPTTLRAVLLAFVEPLVQLHADPLGQHFARMAARDLSAPTPEADANNREFFDPMAHAFIDAFQALYPARTREELAWCYQFMLGALLHFLSDTRVQRLSGGSATPADPARQPLLLAFIEAGFAGVLGKPSTTPASTRAKVRQP